MNTRSIAGELGAFIGLRDLALDYPEPVTEALDHLDRMEAEAASAGRRVSATAEAAKVSAGARITRGEPADEARASYEADRIAAGEAAAAQDAAGLAVVSARTRARKAVAANRDGLIAALGERATALVEEAGPLARKLERFAPAYDAETILREGKPAEVEAYRKAVPMGEEFARLRSAFLATWRTATANPALTTSWPADWRPGLVGGIHAWAEPLEVRDVDVRDGVDGRLLSVARWHEAGTFRLATSGEVLALFREFTMELAWPDGARRPRPVYLPAGPVSNRDRPRYSGAAFA